MTSLTAEVKALEDKVAALQAKADTLDKVQALLAGPVQLTFVSTGDGPVSAGVHTLQEAKDEGRREHVEALNRALDRFHAPPNTVSAILRAEQFFDACDAERAHLAALLAESQAEVAKLLAPDVRDARIAELEAQRTEESAEVAKLRHDAAKTAQQMKDALARIEVLERVKEECLVLRDERDAIAEAVGEAMNTLADAGRIEQKEGADPTLDADVIELCQATAFLIEDLECANARTPNIAAKDVAMLDEMLTADPSPWDLSAANRAVLKRVREYVAGPIEKEQSTISPGLKEIEGKVAAKLSGFVIMRTIPSGRQVFVEGDGGEHTWVSASELAHATKYATIEDAEGTKRGLKLKRTRIVDLGEMANELSVLPTPPPPDAKKRSKKAKEPAAPPPDAFTAQGFVITKVSADGRRFYVMPNASPDHPHSVWCVGKVAARIFESMTAALDERKRLHLKLGDAVPTEMVDEFLAPPTAPKKRNEADERREYARKEQHATAHAAVSVETADRGPWIIRRDWENDDAKGTQYFNGSIWNVRLDAQTYGDGEVDGHGDPCTFADAVEAAVALMCSGGVSDNGKWSIDKGVRVVVVGGAHDVPDAYALKEDEAAA